MWNWTGGQLFLHCKKVQAKSVIWEYMKKSVSEYLIRPEHSITLPGKRDVLIIRKKKHQKIQLTEFIHIVHQNYNGEFPHQKVSRAFFSRIRQKEVPYVLPVSCHNTSVCCHIRPKRGVFSIVSMWEVSMKNISVHFYCNCIGIRMKISEKME